MGADRVQRLEERLRRTGAHHDDRCFQQFLWFPSRDRTWELVVGKAIQYHADLWRQVGREHMAEAWRLSTHSMPWSLESGLIPTGYVDFTNLHGSDIPYLVLPETLPSGWTEEMVKSRLECGSKIHRVEWDPGRNADPMIVESYIRMFERSW